MTISSYPPRREPQASCRLRSLWDSSPVAGETARAARNGRPPAPLAAACDVTEGLEGGSDGRWLALVAEAKPDATLLPT